jgi:hypothetical protein
MKDLAIATITHLGYETCFFHILKQARCTVVTNAQMALHQ